MASCHGDEGARPTRVASSGREPAPPRAMSGDRERRDDRADRDRDAELVQGIEEGSRDVTEELHAADDASPP